MSTIIKKNEIQKKVSNSLDSITEFILEKLFRKYIPMASSVGVVIGLSLLFKHFENHDALAYFPMAASNISTTLTIAFYSAAISLTTVLFFLLPSYELAKIIKENKKRSSILIFTSLILSLATLLYFYKPNNLIFLSAIALTIFNVIYNLALEFRKNNKGKVETVNESIDSIYAFIASAITPFLFLLSAYVIFIPSGNFEAIPLYYMATVIYGAITILLIVIFNIKAKHLSLIMTLLVTAIFIFTPIGDRFASNVIIKPSRTIIPLKSETIKYLESARLSDTDNETVMKELSKRENLIWVDENMIIIKVMDKIIKFPSSLFSDSYVISKKGA
ncbi:hypothetical protein AB9R84_09040 [Oceanimonas smirnovii]|uniref:hypothetical protein n=1 Tax=Oceanimonas smirnovii TaxID=264574 RepID=UPI003AAD07B8